MRDKFWYFFTTLRRIFALFLSRKLLIVSIFAQIPPTKTLKMKYITSNLCHTLKCDSKTQTIFFGIFCTTSTKVAVLPHFQTLQIIKYGPLKFFPHIPFENYTLSCPRKWKKSKLIFWTVWLIFSRWVTYNAQIWEKNFYVYLETLSSNSVG